MMARVRSGLRPGREEETEVEAQGCEKDDLEQVMRRLAAGDEAAVVTLYERYGSSIAAAVRHVARSRPGRLDDDDVGGAVLDVCFELARVAGGWSPVGGALPWVWARHRVAGAVDRALGQQAQSLDDQRSEVLDRLGAGAAPGPAAPEASLLDTLNRLAAQDAASRQPVVVHATTVGVRPGPAGEATPAVGPGLTSTPGGPSAHGPVSEGPAADPGVASTPGGPSAHGPASDGSPAHGSPRELSLVGASRAPADGSPGDPAPVDPAAVRAESQTLSRGALAVAPERIDLTDSPGAAVGVGLLAEAMDRGGVSIRDRELLLEYAYEKHSGNGAPAASVAPMFDMREVSVRQAARRTRERLLRLAASEKRFAPLADLPLLA
jgi:hypothetical protein